MEEKTVIEYGKGPAFEAMLTVWVDLRTEPQNI